MNIERKKFCRRAIHSGATPLRVKVGLKTEGGREMEKENFLKVKKKKKKKKKNRYQVDLMGRNGGGGVSLVDGICGIV